VLTLANFSGKQESCDLEIMALMTTTFETWLSNECPFCKKGSRAYSARKDWYKLFPESRGSESQKTVVDRL